MLNKHRGIQMVDGVRDLVLSSSNGLGSMDPCAELLLDLVVKGFMLAMIGIVCLELASFIIKKGS